MSAHTPETCQDCGQHRPVRFYMGRERCHECEQAYRDTNPYEEEVK